MTVGTPAARGVNSAHRSTVSRCWVRGRSRIRYWQSSASSARTRPTPHWCIRSATRCSRRLPGPGARLAQMGLLAVPTGKDGSEWGVVLYDNVPGGAGMFRQLLECPH